MPKLVKKIIIFSVITSFIYLNGCEGSGFSLSKPGSSSSNNGSIVRGPTGGGLGGGILVADNNGRPLANTKYELYFNNGYKQEIKSGYTDSQGRIALSGSTLTDDMIQQIERGSANIVVEVYDGDEKNIAQGTLIINNSDNTTDEFDLG